MFMELPSFSWNYFERKKLMKFYIAIKNGETSQFFEQNTSVDNNFHLSFDFFRDWIQKKNCISEVETFLSYLEKEEEKSVVKPDSTKYIEQLVSQQNDYAMHLYAYMLFSGNGIPKNTSQAHTHYILAISQGNSHSLNTYGIMHYYGRSLEKNQIKAFQYFKKAVEKGNINALNNLGYMMISQEGGATKQDFELGMEYMKKARYYNDSYALYNYSMSKLDKNDINEALSYMKKACKKNFVGAFYSYGNICLGLNEKLTNIPKAMKYFKKAIKLGCLEAAERYNYLLKKYGT